MMMIYVLSTIILPPCIAYVRIYMLPTASFLFLYARVACKKIRMEAGGLGWCLRMAVSGGGPASLRTVQRRSVSLLTVPSEGGSGGPGGITRRDSLPAVAAAAGGRGLGEAGARAWRGGRATAAVELSGVVSTVGRRARWRAPRRERKRSHSTSSSRDDDGVE